MATIIILLVALFAYTGISSAASEVRFVKTVSKKCMKKGQVIGFVDKNDVKEAKDFLSSVGIKNFPKYLTDMKTQAKKMNANRIVVLKMDIEYVRYYSAETGMGYDFKNGTYKAIF